MIKTNEGYDGDDFAKHRKSFRVANYNDSGCIQILSYFKIDLRTGKYIQPLALLTKQK